MKVNVSRIKRTTIRKDYLDARQRPNVLHNAAKLLMSLIPFYSSCYLKQKQIAQSTPAIWTEVINSQQIIDKDFFIKYCGYMYIVQYKLFTQPLHNFKTEALITERLAKLIKI